MPPRNETELLEQTIELAMLRGWRVTHVRPARTDDGWRTPYQGHSGLPDLILARRGQVLLAELKSNDRRAKPTPDQQAWLAAAGGNGFLWRPTTWESEVIPTLTAPVAAALDSPERAR